jgi:hypothetical protein
MLRWLRSWSRNLVSAGGFQISGREEILENVSGVWGTGR